MASSGGAWLSREGAVRVASVALSVGAAAAVTVTLLSMFQDSADTPSAAAQRAAAAVASSSRKEHDKEAAAAAAAAAAEAPLSQLGLERVGTGLDLFPDYIAGLLRLSAQASRGKHGAGYINNFGQTIVLVTRPEHAWQVLKQHVSHDLGGMKAASAAYFGEQVLFILEGKPWRALRKTMLHSFLPRQLPLMASDVTSVALELAQRLGELAAESQGRPVDMHFVVSMYHLSAIGRAAFDFELDCVSKVAAGPNFIIESFEYLLRELPRRAYSQDAKLREDYTSDTEDNREWRRHARAVRDQILVITRARLEARARGAPRRSDLLDAMIASYEQDAGRASNSPEEAEALVAALGDNLVELLFAGYNTVAAALGSALYYCSQDCQLQRRLQAEADAALEALPAGAAVDLAKLPLARAVFNEALRLATPVPLVYRSAEQPTQLAPDLTLPPGAIWIPAIYIQTDPAVWGKDADAFRPDRWLASDAPPPPGAFLAFSGGPRECIGKHFAYLEGLTALAALFKTFSFSCPAEYRFAPTFTGFGLRPFDASTGKVCVPLHVERRVFTSDNIYNWSPGKPARPS
jgi:cytochrome P450